MSNKKDFVLKTTASLKLPLQFLKINNKSFRVKTYIKIPVFVLFLLIYLFISPHSAVKANFEEKVIPYQTQKIVKISSEIISKKIPIFITPINGYISNRFLRFHPGIDIPNPSGSPVKAACDGEVIFTGFVNSGHGNLIIIKHNLGFESYYAHLSKIEVQTRQNVTKGQRIGKVGSTGNSTGSHLHFEIHQNGVSKNPLQYIKP